MLLRALLPRRQILIESLDIARRLDEDPAFGPPVLAPAAGRKDIDDWVASSAMIMRRLLRPRHAVTPLPEFQVGVARAKGSALFSLKYA